MRKILITNYNQSHKKKKTFCAMIPEHLNQHVDLLPNFPSDETKNLTKQRNMSFLFQQ